MDARVALGYRAGHWCGEEAPHPVVGRRVLVAVVAVVMAVVKTPAIPVVEGAKHCCVVGLGAQPGGHPPPVRGKRGFRAAPAGVVGIKVRVGGPMVMVSVGVMGVKPSLADKGCAPVPSATRMMKGGREVPGVKVDRVVVEATTSTPPVAFKVSQAGRGVEGSTLYARV